MYEPLGLYLRVLISGGNFISAVERGLVSGSFISGGERALFPHCMVFSLIIILGRPW